MRRNWQECEKVDIDDFIDETTINFDWKYLEPDRPYNWSGKDQPIIENEGDPHRRRANQRHEHRNSEDVDSPDRKDIYLHNIKRAGDTEFDSRDTADGIAKLRKESSHNTKEKRRKSASSRRGENDNQQLHRRRKKRRRRRKTQYAWHLRMQPEAMACAAKGK